MTEQEKARDAIRADYDVNDRGIIQSLGKFENEPEYAPYFWQLTLNGSAEILDWSDGASTYLVAVENEDYAAWPALGADTVVIHVQESDTGFVVCDTLTAEELALLHAENEYDNENDYQDDNSDDSDAESDD